MLSPQEVWVIVDSIMVVVRGHSGVIAVLVVSLILSQKFVILFATHVFMRSCLTCAISSLQF